MAMTAVATTAVGVVPKTGEVLNIKEAAACLGLSIRATIKLVDDKVLRAIDISAGRYRNHRLLRIPLAEMNRFIRAHSTQPLNDT